MIEITFSRLILLPLLLLWLSGCASITGDIEIESRSDPRINFADYSTYGWMRSATIVNDPRGHWEPPNFDADAEIRFLINRELRKRGMSEAAAQPDMVVTYAAGIDMTTMRTEIDPDHQLKVLENTPQGALAIILVDAATRRAIWAGLATADIKQDPDPETVKKRLDYAVSTMMRTLPD